MNNKKIIKEAVCTNCGSKKHTYKYCSEPVTSWGVVLVAYGNYEKQSHDEIIDLNEQDVSIKSVQVETNADRLIISSAYTNIKFLMISRKNSVGYVEFIRGRYRSEKIDQVIYLFKQMMQSEIDKINYSLTIDDGFEYLWKDFWRNKYDSQYLLKDKLISKSNYDILKINGVEGPDLDLTYIVSTVKAEYNIEEWGFPKGRKNRVETEEECAIREFKEESGYLDEDFKIIENIKPLIEDFNGTNGIRYRHIYYVAELITDKLPRNNITDSQKDEIGNIQFMDFTTANECIRDYHVPRKIILERLFTYYLGRILIANKDYNLNNIYYYKNIVQDQVQDQENDKTTKIINKNKINKNILNK